MKVLLSAYSCSPTAGSEPAIGWNWARCIGAEGHEVTVATRAINRKDIEGYCTKRGIQNPQFLFHDLPALVQKLYKLPFGNYLYYSLWQYTLAKKAAELHKREKFDQVQHITWGSFRLPSFMGKLGIPFIFGPVAGGEDAPKGLRKGLGLRGRVWDALRRFSNSLFIAVPFMRRTYSEATEIVATTPETLEAIPAAYREKGRVQLAIGIDSESLMAAAATAKRATAPDRAALEMLFVGRILPWKGLHLAFRAIASLGDKAREVRFTIIGSGSDEPRLKKLARHLEVEDRIRWKSSIPRQELIGMYPDFDLFLFPSLHDSGGLAVLEAMSFGLPVVCLDLGGPGVSVNNTAGCVITTKGRSEDEVAEAIAGSLERILCDAAMLASLSDGARRRARALTWEAAVQTLYVTDLAAGGAGQENQCYEQVI